MTLLMGVILILGALLWRVNSSWEWDIPQKWQAKIRAWKEGLSSPTHIINYDWDVDPENTELEKHLWLLKRAYPRLRKKYRAPIRAEVCVYPNFPPEQNKIYISCLQRRFPEISLSECPLGSENAAEHWDRCAVSVIAGVKIEKHGEKRGQAPCFVDSRNGDEGRTTESKGNE
ncbi:hypothetical protein [Desulfosporosinus sp. BICA1-9]|uniref:hypothetical protein n=1 Tax=Desulfosporosinus sp. BICA1-9 TaxID=1531958 RepID=UPI00054B812F|nr:hypothetical protein [Desulfosporosinus sp. BICA1-9]KJS50796.1 MAG: hypothetical protein VR66_00845 [Peptococcaceae bacterium BRH_c23]KJS89549.1 MAG: hypothetical protein JL57_06775 [Desulfosporosinus sp. BICA1-9]HBW36999.1 hypothetical protein [Desulfosporosinus sp.]